MKQTDEFKRIRKTYTRIEVLDDGCNACLQVGSQSFAVVRATTRKRASFFRDMLTIALQNLIKAECVREELKKKRSVKK